MYILLVGVLYAPDYLQLARGYDDGQENLALALVYACGVQAQRPTSPPSPLRPSSHPVGLTPLIARHGPA